MLWVGAAAACRQPRRTRRTRRRGTDTAAARMHRLQQLANAHLLMTTTTCPGSVPHAAVVARSVSPQTSITGSFLSYSAPDRGAEYCDERICVSVSVYLSLYDHIFGTARPIFTKFLCVLPMAVDRSSSGSVVICYVFPILWMISYLHISQGCSTSPPG